MVVNKFSSDDPYALSQQMIAAASRTRSDLNVILIENDQVHATNVFLTGQALTNNAANPVSAVTVVGQQTIGSGISDGSIQPDGNPCFVGSTLFTLWDSLTTFEQLYEMRRRSFALSFDKDNERVQGEILQVMRTWKESYMRVQFEDGSIDEVIPEHRYFNGFEYVPIKSVDEIWTENNEPLRVISRTIVSKGVYVYNAHIKEYQNYCANGHRVHNVKPIDSDQQLT